MRIAEIMTSPVVTVSEETPLEEVARLMTEHDVGGVPVLDGRGRLVGIVTDSDFAGRLRRVPFTLPAVELPTRFGEWIEDHSSARHWRRARRLPARTAMTAPVVTAEEDEPIEVVVERMLRFDVDRIPVLRGDELVGIVARRDLLKLMLGPKPEPDSEPGS